MCGICGIWNRDGRPIDLAALGAMTSALRHRGPDDEGYLLVDTRSGRAVLCGGENTAPELALQPLSRYMGEPFDLALGFRRLSILDLSPAGHQPMSSRDGRYWVVFNGEVYNYLELRGTLSGMGYSFKTGCDTEVILAAYDAWGPDCLRRFNGMWGLAIWDNRERRLFVSRDRLGVKPFYVAEGGEGNQFAFASEIKGLIASGLEPFRPSQTAIARFIAQGGYLSHLAGETFFEGVREFPAAHYSLISADSACERRFWSLPPRSEESHTFSGAATVFRQYSELFTDSVRLRLRADVPVGTCLSGGLDSSSIVATAGRLMQSEHAVSLERLGDHQQTFSAIYDTEGRWNERVYIDRVVDATRAAGNYVYPTADRLWADLERLVWHQDEPFQSTSIFAQWCVMSLAHERGVTVLLDGQGADEVLGGYRPYAILLGELLRSARLLRAVRELHSIHDVSGSAPLKLLARAVGWQLPRPLITLLRESRVKAAVSSSGLLPEVEQSLFAAHTEGAGEPYLAHRNLHDHLARITLEDSLPNLLRHEDRNSMAFSIESRVPFLDYRLVEYAFTQAAPYRLHKGWTKWIQRKAVQKLLPSEVVWRRDKVGFETPEQQWFREGREHILSILNEETSAGDYLDMAAVRREAPTLLDKGETGKVWRWVNLVVWLRCFEQTSRKQVAPESAPLIRLR